MKKILYLIAISAICLSACTKEVQQEDTESKESKDLVMLTFTASSEFTKAYLNSDRSVSFRAGDKISVFANGTNYELTTTEGGDKAVFSGLGEVAATYYALYPYSATATIDGDKIQNVSIGTGSDGSGAGTFNSKRAVSVAVTTGEDLHFKQITALLRFTVPADVTDLDEVVMFNRDNSGSNLAGAISGTFNVTPSADGRPVVEVTTAKFQAGIKGPTSGEAFPAGDYYLPILPATLTDTKGFDLKLTFKDGFVGRVFSGVSRTFEACQVYNIGTIRKVDEFVDNGFEQQNITDYTGNTGALSVIENPFKTSVNPSNYVLKNQVSGTGPTSGYIEIASGAAAGLRKFPSSVRGNYDKIRIKIYLGNNAYYPRLRRASTDAPAAKINGVPVDSKATWDANVRTDDWNILEYNASDMTSGWTSFGSLATYQIRPMVNYDDGSNVSGYDEDTNNRCVYIDDITFVLK